MTSEPLPLNVEALQWEEENESHLADHDLTIAMVEEARDNDPLFFRNIPGRVASHIMIGVTNDGHHLRVSVLQVAPGLWRPITGWQSGEAYRLWTRYRGGTE